MNSSFITSKWSVQHSVDLQHWRKFEPFRPLEQQVKATGGRWVPDLQSFNAHTCLPVLPFGQHQARTCFCRSDRLGQHSHIFMRWKVSTVILLVGCTLLRGSGPGLSKGR